MVPLCFKLRIACGSGVKLVHQFSRLRQLRLTFLHAAGIWVGSFFRWLLGEGFGLLGFWFQGRYSSVTL